MTPIHVYFQAAKEKQKIRSEEIQITIVERRKQIEVEEKEIMRKEKELMATVKRPAEAESFKMEVTLPSSHTRRGRHTPHRRQSILRT